jgi:lipopolysaccharide/colanic/teichoic acid biosynthesis glycosyltransferase
MCCSPSVSDHRISALADDLLGDQTRIERTCFLQAGAGRKDGKVFIMYKFRSMYQDAEKLSGPTWAGKKDPRVTFVGAILRKLHLDEIPQFINI